VIFLELTVDDKKHFEDAENWQCGPCYDITLCLKAGYPLQKVSEILLEKSELLLWRGSIKKSPIYTILKTENAPAIGFIHTYRNRPELNYSVYSLSIYPKQFENYVGAEPWEEVSKMNIQRFQQLHYELFKIIKIVADLYPVLCASICDETDGWIEEFNEGFGVYMLPKLANLLNVETVPSKNVKGFEFIKL
jgi:hypothetical protein